MKCMAVFSVRNINCFNRFNFFKIFRNFKKMLNFHKFTVMFVTDFNTRKVMPYTNVRFLFLTFRTDFCCFYKCVCIK